MITKNSYDHLYMIAKNSYDHLYMITKNSYDHLYLMEVNLSFNDKMASKIYRTIETIPRRRQNRYP
jgi:hypothetical protein